MSKRDIKIVNVNNAGKRHAIPAGQLVVGDVLVHSFGLKSDLLEKTSETDKTISFRLREREKTRRHPNGYECVKRFKKTSLQAIELPPAELEAFNNG